MKKIAALGLIIGAIGSLAFVMSTQKPYKHAAAVPELKWYTWEEAVALNKTQPKKIFVDVYTDWCGWCKKMDKTTFHDPKIADYLAKNFYPVKLNAEQKADIEFNNQKFQYIESGRSGVHSLAYALLDGQMSYPTVVYLNEKFERIMISPGYKEPADIIKELKFAFEEKYLTESWEDYQSQN